MTSPGPTPGVRTYLAGFPAQAGVRADLRPHVKGPDPDTLSQIPEHAATFELPDYAVLRGWPTGRPPLEARNYTRVGLGAWTFSDQPPRPDEISLQASLRWLPSDSSYVPGTIWTPTIGQGLNWIFDPQTAPVLYDDYSFKVTGGDEISLPALVFPGGAWGELDDSGWSAQAFTFILVAVMMPHLTGDTYGILESTSLNNPTDPDAYAPTDWGLRYQAGQLYFWSGVNQLHHQVNFPQARAVMMAIALDATEGKFAVASAGNLTTSFFDTSNVSVFDLQLLLAKTGNDASTNTTANMAMLDLAYYDRALSFAEIADVFHQLNAVYGAL